MWEHSLQEEEFGPDGDLVVKSTDTMRSLPPPRRLERNMIDFIKKKFHLRIWKQIILGILEKRDT